jgi:DNA-binding CsgD family transcriptional regulator
MAGGPVGVTVLALTPAEVRVLAQTAHGHTAREIAGLVGCSMWTAKDHQKSIRAKLGARSNAHAVAVACLAGLSFEERT